MAEEKKYPVVMAGSFLTNENGEVFLRQSSDQIGYTCINEEILSGEDIGEVIRKSVKEKTNLDILQIEFIGAVNGNNKDKKDKHLIFLDYKVLIKNSNKFLQKDNRKYKWLTPNQWIETKKKQLAPYIFETMEKLNKQGDNYDDLYRRALADYQNLLKRTAQEKEEFAKYANEQLLYEMIPVYDNLKMAINHSNSDNNDSWLDGVKYVVKQFQDVLVGLGVEEVKTVGEKFDHNTMEAVDNEATDNKKNDGLVAKELKAGYWLKGKVIIPAKVVVYKFEK